MVHLGSAGMIALFICCTMVFCCPRGVPVNACLQTGCPCGPSLLFTLCIVKSLYGDSMFLHFRKMKNHQVRTEKQRTLHQTMAKVRPPTACATPVAYISDRWGVRKSRERRHCRARAKTRAGVLGNSHITRVKTRSSQQASGECLSSKRLFVSLDLLCRRSTSLMKWREGKLAANLSSKLRTQAYEEAL